MISELRAKIGQGKLVKTVAEFTLAPSTLAVLDIETHGFEKKPGDSAYFSPQHGVAGIALSNASGESCYILVDDGRNYGGIPISEAVRMVNAWLKRGVRALILHFSKFDLSFMLHRGLDISGIIIKDTWIGSSIKSNGVYSSNKLKDIARTRLGIDTSTATEKDAALKAANSEDFGDIPIEIISRYAGDDCIYTMLVFLTEEKMTVEEMACHDLYVRNTLHLIQAESRGVCLNLPMLKEGLAKIETKLVEDRVKLKDLLGSAAIDVDSEQDMLKYLHQKNLHPGPRDYLGSVQFIFDREFIMAVDHPLAEAYHSFHRRKVFQRNFSARCGVMKPRVFSQADGQAGFHVSHLSSIFSKGGLTICKLPNFDDVHLDNTIRAFFIPRKGHEFVVLRAWDLPVMLLMYYCNNKPLMQAIRERTLLKTLAKTLDVDDTDVVAVLLQQQIEGSGAGVLEQRMGRIKAKFKGKKTIYALIDKFTAAVAGYKEMRERLTKALEENGSIKDRQGRVLKVDKNKFYRAHSMLIQSSNGSLLSYYLDLFCRLGAETKAHLVLAHEKEFIFEVPAGDKDFAVAVTELTKACLVEPRPVWEIAQGPTWQMSELDSHEQGSRGL